MYIYKAERQIGDKIKNNKLSYLTVASVDIGNACTGSGLPIPDSVKGGEDTVDLHFIKSVLVSVGWNLNEDVFDKEEVWLAKSTPANKPFNLEHNCKDVIGHIIDTYPIDIESKKLEDNLTLDELPLKYHILTNSVIYKYWDDKDRQEQIDKIIAEISEGKWFVSMEALFKSFDYAMLYNDNSSRIVGRNSNTAFLTKHLRAYGGNGEYNGARIGRLIRGITFSGKGLVRKPANPESIIFAKVLDFTNNLGYTNNSKDIIEVEKNPMVEVEQYVKENVELKDRVNKLEAQLKEIDQKSVQVQIESLKADISEKSKKISEYETGLQASANHVIAIQKTVDDLTAQLYSSNNELLQYKVAQLKVNRGKVLATETGLSLDNAVSIVETLSGLDNEQFNTFVVKAKENYKIASNDKNVTVVRAEEILDKVEVKKEPVMAMGSVNEIDKTRKNIYNYLSNVSQEN